ncbi:MAG TPA: ArsI/CadI family heavy metal resistance metalloenzyme [Pyrinomonadaceae bacterium]|jgi:catechol 2,3-dioxygenase-like lactoylglutathione lyase family enzyme|nr:ArsI/CadI family heavy metal resistance metalloenzyme [Pyrinomonadaceae bacterium]
MEKENAAAQTVNTLKAHLALNVRSVERSTEFYRAMLGLEPAKVRPGYAKFDSLNPPLNLTLNEVPFRDSGALSHLGIQVASTEDVEKMRARWRAAGLATRDEMQTNCCYALQDKTWVRDPDGNNWEAFVVLEDNLQETTNCCASSDDQLVQLASACAAGELAETPSCCSTADACVS